MVFMLLCSGCWDARDIEDRDILTATMNDKTVDGYAFYAEIAPIYKVQSGSDQGGDPGGAEKPAIVKAEGKTYIEARARLETEMNHPLFLGAVQVIFMTDKLAYSGIEEYMYRVREANDYRKTADVVVAQGSPEDVLKAIGENENSVGFALRDTLQDLEGAGAQIRFPLADVLEKLASPYKGFLLPTVAVVAGQITPVGYSVMDGGKCQGFIPVKECRGIVLLLGREPDFHYIVPCREGRLTVEARMTGRDVQASYENGSVHFSLKFGVAASLMYTDKDLNIDREIEQEAKQKLGQMIEGDIMDAIRISQKGFSCDYLGFNSVFCIAYPDAYAQMDWAKEYPKADFSVAAAVDFDVFGEMDYDPHVGGEVK